MTHEWAAEVGRVEVDPTDRLKRVPVPQPHPRPLSADEMDLVLRESTGTLNAWLQLAYLAGLRAHEIAKFRGEDIDRDRVTVVGKGRQLATLPTHDALWELAQRYPRQGYWFPSRRTVGHVAPDSVSCRTRALFRRLGIPGSIHRVRGPSISSLLRNGANVRVVQDLMRHRSLASTEHYLAATEDEMVAAIRTLGRLAA